MAEAELGILEVLANVYERLDLGWLVFGHSLFCCTLCPELKGKYFLHYWTCLLIAFGGGMLSGLLLQVEDPKVGGVAPFQNNIIGVAYTIAWWLINYCWGDIPAKIHSLLPVRMVTKACLNVLKTTTIAMRVDQAVLVFPGVIFAHLVLGTMAGSGGKFLMDMVHGSYGHLKGPDEASAPAFSLRSAFFTALAYYLTVYIAQVMPARDCKALLTTLVILHGVLQDLTDRTLDFTEHSSWLALRAANIPHPSGPEPRKPGKKNKAAAKQD